MRALARNCDQPPLIRTTCRFRRHQNKAGTEKNSTASARGPKETICRAPRLSRPRVQTHAPRKHNLKVESKYASGLCSAPVLGFPSRRLRPEVYLASNHAYLSRRSTTKLEADLPELHECMSNAWKTCVDHRGQFDDSGEPPRSRPRSRLL